MFDSNILIVDDEESNIILLECLLQKVGYTRVRTATEPLRGLEMAQEVPPDLILLDLNMPVMDGFGFMERQRARQLPGDYLPILVLTADINRETRRRALAGGATDFLTKPFEADEVMLRCGNLLQTRGLYQALAEQNRLLEEKVRQRTLSLEGALTDLQRSQQQHIEQERLRALGEMSSGVAMDFNNQLTVLIGYSELLLLNNAQMLNNKDVATRYVQTIHAAAQNSAVVVSRLRDFSRSRESTDIFLAVDLQALVDEVARLTRPKWREQARAAGLHVQIRLELEPVLPIAGNAAELREVVASLIFNAVDALTGGGGSIVLRTRSADGMVKVEVADDGIGMTGEVRARCLEPFFTTKIGEHSGMGLSKVYGVVTRHNGGLDIATAPGQGTTVSLRFPVADDTAMKNSRHLEGTQWESRSLRVLVVEVDEEVRELVGEYLRHDQHHVTTARTGCEALDLLEKDNFDLVVTDLALEEMSGEELAEEIKARGSTPVILLTAAAGLLGGQDGKPNVVDAVVRKPLESGDLWRAVAQVMGKAG